MPNMRKNQHRWKAWVDDRIRLALEEAGEALIWAWNSDKKYPKSYPVNTWYLFVQIDERLRNEPAKPVGKLPPPPPPPKSLSDLIQERTIRAAYEDQNDGSYQEALIQAWAESGEGDRAFRKILRAIQTAYIMKFHGVEHAPKPRIHFLHRQLLEITDSDPLRGLTLEGIVEFLDDICPCGGKHQPDAVRKLSRRWSRGRKT
jgi:hypothetical protein